MSHRANQPLPASWLWVEIQQVAEVITGNTPPTSESSNYGGNIPFIKPPQLVDIPLFSAPETLSDKGAAKARILPKGAVLVSCIGNLGKTAILKRTGATNQQINALVFEPSMNPEYGFFYAQTLEPWLNSVSSATTVSIVNKGKFETAPFPLAPLAEQTRIVEKLEELFSDLDAGVTELKAAQKKLAQYRQSLLKAAVVGELTAEWRKKKGPLSPTPLPQGGEGLYLHTSNQSQTFNCTATESSTKTPLAPCGRGAGGEGETGTQLLERILKERRARWEEKQLARFKEQGKTPPKGWQDKYSEPVQPDATNLPELPVGWVWASLSQVGWLDRGKSKHRPRNAPFLFGGPYPFIQTGDIREADTYINQASSSYSEAGLAQSRLWPKGTMCITIAANIGKTAILDIEACFPDSIVGFMSASEHVSVDFIEYFMRSAQQGLEAEAPATAQKNINLEILERVCLPLPPMIEQIYIVQELRQLLESASQQENAIHHSLTQAAAQRKNILKAAFSGQLVPQDPNDEPASVLLERIRAERAVGESTPKKRGSRKKVEKA